MFGRLDPVLRKQAVGKGHHLIQWDTHIHLQAVQKMDSHVQKVKLACQIDEDTRF